MMFSNGKRGKGKGIGQASEHQQCFINYIYVKLWMTKQNFERETDTLKDLVSSIRYLLLWILISIYLSLVLDKRNLFFWSQNYAVQEEIFSLKFLREILHYLEFVE